MKKGEIYEGCIDHVAFPNKGRVYIDDKTITVKNGIPGQKVKFQINKKKHNNFEGRLLEVLEASTLETEKPACNIFPACGGCMYQTMDYKEQLNMKAKQVKDLLDHALMNAKQVKEDGSPDYVFEGIKASPLTFAYRNKMEYSFGDACKDGPLSLGLHKKGSTYDVLTAFDCAIVHPDFNRILSAVLSYCEEKNLTFCHKITHIGYLRHLLLRRSAASGDILAAIVTSSQEGDDFNQLTDILKTIKLEGNLIGFLHIVNDSLADVVKSDTSKILFGQDFFYETILGLRFKITPFSFFQTNSKGAELLYSTARDMIGDIDQATVFDLYSGTGTIGQIMSAAADKVIGVEIVEEAVEAANENAKLNGLSNCTFLAGDVLKVLDEIEEKPDFIVLDPPRDGINPKALSKIIHYGVDRMIYISCKPTSLARDLELLITAGYKLEKAVCVDMFPHTVHVETVCLLSKK